MKPMHRTRGSRAEALTPEPMVSAAVAPGLQAWTLRAVQVDRLLAAAVAAGCVFRIVQYAANRSLWLDESMLALNILDRPLTGLTGRLSFDQAAPPGFLVIEKCFTELFGSSEYALRLFPLLCGLASLPLFAALARRILDRYPAVLATLLFACATSPVYYTSEVKQYSGDVAAALTLLLLGAVLSRGDVSARKAGAVAVLGVLAVLVSYPAVFVVGGVACVLAVRAAVRRSWPSHGSIAALGMWLSASLLVVIASRHTAARVEELFSADTRAYVKPTPTSFLPWTRELPTQLAQNIGFGPLGKLHWAAVVLAVVGAVSLGTGRRRLYAAFFAGALALPLIASALRRYPLAERTVLFLVPVAIILLAEGVAVVAGGIRNVASRRVAAASLAVLVLAVPGWHAVERLVRPLMREEMKPALTHIRDRWQPGDTLYVSDLTQFALRYYLECDCFSPAEGDAKTAWRFRRTPDRSRIQKNALRSMPPHFVVGRASDGDRRTYVSEIAALRGRGRVWLLYTHVGDATELSFLRHELPRDLERIGRRLDAFTAVGATVYLYDLRRPPR